MRLITAVALIALCLSACRSYGPGAAGAESNSTPLTEDEKHRLYTAALAASDAPLDTDTFKDVCRKIGIFGADDKPNDKYMAFIAAHVDWGLKLEADNFRLEINTKEKATEYLKKNLP